MRRLVIVTALAAVLCSASVAIAYAGTGSGRLVPPAHTFDGLSGGEMLGAFWSYGLSVPRPDHPALGNGDPCVRFGDTGKLLAIYGGGAQCTVGLGATVFVNGFSGFCSDAERPPFFAVGEAAQRECVLAILPPVVESISLTVDGDPPVDLYTSRYAIFAPQQTVELPPANILLVSPGTITFTPYGWEAWLTSLPRGRHTVRAETLFTDGSAHITAHVIDVV